MPTGRSCDIQGSSWSVSFLFLDCEDLDAYGREEPRSGQRVANMTPAWIVMLVSLFSLLIVFVFLALVLPFLHVLALLGLTEWHRERAATWIGIRGWLAGSLLVLLLIILHTAEAAAVSAVYVLAGADVSLLNGLAAALTVQPATFIPGDLTGGWALLLTLHRVIGLVLLAFSIAFLVRVEASQPDWPRRRSGS